MTPSSMFGLPHLSEDAVAAYADGVLSPAAMVRAEKHCAECADCAQAVRGQREAVLMLRTAATPSLPSGLLDRLTNLPTSDDLPPSRGLPTAMGADGIPVFVAHHRAIAEPGRIPGPIPGLPSQQAPARRAMEHRTRLRVGLSIGALASAAAVVAVSAANGSVKLPDNGGSVTDGPALVAPVVQSSTTSSGPGPSATASNTSAAPGQTRSPFTIVGVGRSPLTP